MDATTGSFDGRVVLVTGASRGLGQSVADWFLSAGARVIGISRTPREHSDERYEHLIVDVSNESTVIAALAHVGREYSRLDIAVNCAGIASMNHSLLMPAATADRILSVNVTGTFTVCREAAKVMRRRRFGRIVNVGSVAASLKIPGEAMYAASKSAVVTFSQVFAKEIAPLGVTCNVVCPGPVATNLIAGIPADKIDALVRQQAIPRMGTPDDVINAIAFFCRPESEFITGQVLYLGGPA